MEETHNDIDYDLWALLNQARDTLMMVRKNELVKYDITAIEAQALNILADSEESIIPAELSRKMFRRHNSIISLLGRMERNGLITKTRDSKKPNVWNISLTEKGRIASTHSLKRESLHLVMADFKKDEKIRLFHFLKLIRDKALEQLASQPEIDYP